MTKPPTGPTGFGQAADTSDSNEEDNESSPITRDAVLATALEIIDRDGADGLSMRRLGAADRRPDGPLPARAEQGSPARRRRRAGVRSVLGRRHRSRLGCALRAVAHDFRDLALAHPHVVPLLVTRPLATPLGLRPQAPCGHWKPSWPCSPGPASAVPTHCTSIGPCSGSCTAMFSTSCRNSSTAPTRPTTCCGSACTGCRSANSPCSAASPPSWPPTTAPPNSNAASTSCSAGWPPNSARPTARPCQRSHLAGRKQTTTIGRDPRCCSTSPISPGCASSRE